MAFFIKNGLDFSIVRTIMAYKCNCTYNFCGTCGIVRTIEAINDGGDSAYNKIRY